jgi:hypothetical protein
MECSCCGEDRDPGMVAALLCHDDVKICRNHIRVGRSIDS